MARRLLMHCSMRTTLVPPRRGVWARGLAVAAALAPAAATPALAAESATSPGFQVALDTVWVVFAGILVFFMNAGFALLEAGFCRAKNAVNILAKNFTVAAFAGLSFFAIGFGLMFADGNGFTGTSGFLLAGADNSPAMGEAYQGVFSSLSWAGVPLEAKFFFQACFAMAAASIVSGAVAERIQFQSYVVFSLILVALVYGVTGHWIWGGGWLAELGFADFAGSTQVHSVGGWAALVGAFLLGPRLGKFARDGASRPIPGHSMALGTTGGFVLWVGWFGFNAGSTMAADPGAIAHIATTTLLASLAGIVGAILASYPRVKAFDLSMMINGCLAGLVGITAPCAFVSAGSAVLIGLVAGGLVVAGVTLFERIRVDDPVGAVSVHLVGGVWGTLAVGLFAQQPFAGDFGSGLFFGGGVGLLGVQALGVAAVGAFTVTCSLLAWSAIRVVMGLRVDAEEEHLGLDLAEMKTRAYPGEALPGARPAPTPEPEAPAGSPAPALEPAGASRD
jgi:Amt family ammonium transporter